MGDTSMLCRLSMMSALPASWREGSDQPPALKGETNKSYLILEPSTCHYCKAQWTNI